MVVELNCSCIPGKDGTINDALELHCGTRRKLVYILWLDWCKGVKSEHISIYVCLVSLSALVRYRYIIMKWCSLKIFKIWAWKFISITLFLVLFAHKDTLSFFFYPQISFQTAPVPLMTPGLHSIRHSTFLLHCVCVFISRWTDQIRTGRP